MTKLQLVPIKFKVKGLVNIDKSLKEMFKKINVTLFDLNINSIILMRDVKYLKLFRLKDNKLFQSKADEILTFKS